MKKYRLFIFVFLLILIGTQISALEKHLSLKGIPSQGGLIFGTISEAVKQVNLDGEKLHLIGRSFIYGFDRDAELVHEITLIFDDHSEFIKFDIAKYEYDIQKITRVQKKYVAPPADPFLANKIQLEANTLKAIRKQMSKNIFFYADSIFIRPVEKGWISSDFGGQRIINGVPQRPHSGLDIAVPKGTEIKAMTNGVVSLTGDYFYNGKFVLIDHGSGLSSIYLHMSKISVEKGDFVKIGDKIGEVGSTGRSTGNHLHWGIKWYKSRINPSLMLKPQDEFLVFKSKITEDKILSNK
ncbi:MAG: M23 family metallopeptidase [Candidatus Cloacimonetes bacterium]|nr:M23 family metallopeptidase [Candidatus Cloacimonadota bacterium]MCF7813580.1 M23 family metallopeptidase [Candidatus Cloacimonadota bacterium]MCF7868211.1 M23 family metallopeptidase [Candidatus Cloacimonadota bacterium]MCF7883625.1 M23 family metallopeptidase [Candidatus Cloacimonadota bacterium]